MAHLDSASSIVSCVKKLLDSVELPAINDNTSNDFDVCLEKSIATLYEEQNLSNGVISMYLCDKYDICFAPINTRWNFITTASFLLLRLNDVLESNSTEDVKSSLLSVTEEKEVKCCVEICVSLGLIGTLLPGIGIPVERRSKFVHLLKCSETPDIVENNNQLSFITKVLSHLFNGHSVLRSIVFANHLGDFLSALFQLCYTPLLKPGSSNKQKTFTMSEEFYTRLTFERQEFKSVLDELLKTVNQTELLKQIMLLFGYSLQNGPKKHVWFMNACTNILNDTLSKSDGIEILLRAMCDEDYASPLVWKKLDVVARIISTMKSFYHVTCPQVLKMLCYSEQQIQSSEQLKLNNQFSIATCKHLYEHNLDMFHTHIFAHVIDPLVQMGQKSIVKSDTSNVEESSSKSALSNRQKPSDELKNHESNGNNLSNCLIVLDRLFSHVDGLPRRMLLKYANRLFFVYVNIYSSPIFILTKKSLENLLCTLFACFPSEQCDVLLNTLIFQMPAVQCSPVRSCEEVEELDEDDIEENERETRHSEPEPVSVCEDMLDFPPGSIHISSTGNLSYVKPLGEESVPEDYEKYGECVLSLLSKRKDKTASYNLFICLLHNYTKEKFKDDLDRNVVNVKLLNDLVQTIQIEDFISSNPKHIIMFIEFLIKQAISQDQNDPSTDTTDSLCTGLTLLNILMSEQNAPLFLHITPSLETLINHSANQEVNILARQILEQIKATNPKSARGSKRESYEKAMSDACDTLLPVRAHGIMVLTKLIQGGDATAKANKSALLCLFMENLSDEDSYLYLSAVDGLAALATEHADTVVCTLTQHFVEGGRSLELRLKLGEVLMRVARQLGEMLVKYKTHFLNAYLHGCRDEDHLMRTSSLSNLAEICRILSYRVGSILSEIFTCIKCIINSDPYPEPRRAAVMVASFLLCGLKDEALQVLEPILPELYRTLRHIYETDLDDRTRLHAQLALEQLNEAVKSFLTPKLPASFASLRL